MSPCPKCGKAAKHVSFWVPWTGRGAGGGEPQVCRWCPACNLRFDEPVTSLDAVLARFGWQRCGKKAETGGEPA